jgi:hypothetical protein
MLSSRKLATIQAMQRYGGNFVSRLADAMLAADWTNYCRICDAFPEIIKKYSEMAIQMQPIDNATKT